MFSTFLLTLTLTVGLTRFLPFIERGWQVLYPVRLVWGETHRNNLKSIADFWVMRSDWRFGFLWGACIFKDDYFSQSHLTLFRDDNQCLATIPGMVGKYRMFDCNADLRVICERRGQSPFPSQVQHSLAAAIAVFQFTTCSNISLSAACHIQHSKENDNTTHRSDTFRSAGVNQCSRLVVISRISPNLIAVQCMCHHCSYCITT